MIIVDLTGRKFGRLTVVEFSARDKYRQKRWVCVCECGDSKVISATNLLQGKTHSCGCIQKEKIREASTTHGQTSGGKVSPERGTWRNMKNRCYNKKSEDYHLYGERGIVLCDRWKDNFLNFYEDMGIRPSSNHSIERIDVNGNYEPGNCKWATTYEQAKNKRVQRKSRSGVSGVTFTSKSSKWRVNISANGKDMYLGEYADINEAIRVRKQAELKYWKKSS